MVIQPYLFFAGRCQEALDLYRDAVGAEVLMLMRYRESPEPVPPGRTAPGWDDKVMHASVRIGDSVVMASDGCSPEDPSFAGFSLSLTVADAATADRTFARLAEGGSVQMPLTETFWSPRFGMVTDRFGVQWMITLPTEAS